MYTGVKLFTVLIRNIGQNINTVDPDQIVSVRIGTLCQCTCNIVAKESFTIIRAVGNVFPIVILYLIRIRIQIILIADFCIISSIFGNQKFHLQ